MTPHLLIRPINSTTILEDLFNIKYVLPVIVDNFKFTNIPIFLHYLQNFNYDLWRWS